MFNIIKKDQFVIGQVQVQVGQFMRQGEPKVVKPIMTKRQGDDRLVMWREKTSPIQVGMR